MFIIIGTRVFAWGATATTTPYHCSTCGGLTSFIEKTAMRFLTLFFLIPIIPISGKMHLIECPRCKTRFETH